MIDVGERYRAVRRDVDKACDDSGRTPDEVVLLAVSKGQPVERMMAAYDVGVRDFAESYVDEWNAKKGAMPEDTRWHFIGPIQSRTLKANAELFQCAHTIQVIGREKIARILNDVASSSLDVLVQVNIGEEPQKSGVAPDGLDELIAYIDTLEHLNLRGLMAIPPFAADLSETESYFVSMRELFDRLRSVRTPGFDQLSIGMSGDFPLAIAHGATMVRVGTAIFGARNV